MLGLGSAEDIAAEYFGFIDKWMVFSIFDRVCIMRGFDLGVGFVAFLSR